MIASSRSGKGRLLFYCRAAPTGKLTLPHSTRSGQDRSLRTAAHGCLVGRGLDPSGQPGGGRRAVGAGHARPAALKRLPVKGWPRRPPGRACPAPTKALPRQNGARFSAGPVLVGIGNNKKMACLSPHYTILRDLWTPVLRNSTHSAMFTAWSPRRSRYLSIINKSSAVSASPGWAAM